MGEIVRQFLIESIALELNIGDLYQQFSAKYEQDYDFWWKLSIEEMNHAALIESINDIFLTEDFLPADKIELQTIKLRKMNYFIHENIEKFRTDNPLRADAFKLAIEIENSIGESHFELFMTSKPNSEVVKIMQKLNGDDINHASRITKYIFKNGIL